MMIAEECCIISEYLVYLNRKEFPCVAAKAALSKQQVKCIVADNIFCPQDDKAILQFLYNFTDEYRESKDFYNSAAVIFRGPENVSEQLFDNALWQRLQALTNLDSLNFSYDKRVNNSPNSPDFSFSIKEEAFYIIGLHANSARQSRRFGYPTLVFNPHAQFEDLKITGKYGMLKKVVRKRDIAYSGSVNPMLEDFGVTSEVYQYSGFKYGNTWKCPLKINNATTDNHPAP